MALMNAPLVVVDIHNNQLRLKPKVTDTRERPIKCGVGLPLKRIHGTHVQVQNHELGEFETDMHMQHSTASQRLRIVRSFARRKETGSVIDSVA